MMRNLIMMLCCCSVTLLLYIWHYCEIWTLVEIIIIDYYYYEDHSVFKFNGILMPLS